MAIKYPAVEKIAALLRRKPVAGGLILVAALAAMLLTGKEQERQSAGIRTVEPAATPVAEPRHTNEEPPAPWELIDGDAKAALMQERHIIVAKETGFVGATEAPPSLMQAMAEMAGGRKKKRKPAIELSHEEFSGHIQSPSAGKKETQSIDAEPRSSPSGKHSAITRISAPVRHQVFREARAYKEFTNANPGKYPAPHFDREMAVVLVSLSDFPHRIFEFAGHRAEKTRFVILYRVNPFTAAEETDNYYRASVFPKTTLPIILEQVP